MATFKKLDNGCIEVAETEGSECYEVTPGGIDRNIQSARERVNGINSQIETNIKAGLKDRAVGLEDQKEYWLGKVQMWQEAKKNL